jgi:hypothetical protein
MAIETELFGPQFSVELQSLRRMIRTCFAKSLGKILEQRWGMAREFLPLEDSVDEVLPKVLDDSTAANPSAVAVFFAWETLRLCYNATLIIIALAMGSFTGIVGSHLFWAPCIYGAFLCNICFCVGPVIEGYLCWFGANRLAVRCFLFVSAVLLSVAIEIVAVWGLVNRLDKLDW